MGWLPEIAAFMKDSPKSRRPKSDAVAKKKTPRLGILAFETAKIMSKLLSLYKSLSGEEISKLKNNVVKSEGVSFLTSRDEEFLLSLACAERLEDLNRVAVVVSRLGKKCSESWLNRFDLVFTDFKLGIVDYGKLEYGGFAHRSLAFSVGAFNANGNHRKEIEALEVAWRGGGGPSRRRMSPPFLSMPRRRRALGFRGGGGLSRA